MHIRDQRNSNNFHGYKKIDLIINSKFIDPNKHTAKELHHMDLQETIVLRIQRERGSHLATNYGPEGLQRRIIGEAPMEVVNPIRDGV